MSGGIRMLSVAVLFVVSACGQEYVRPDSDGQELSTTATEPLQLAQPQKKTLRLFHRQLEDDIQPPSLAPAEPVITLSAVGLAAADGTKIHAAVGLMSCGVLITGRGDGLVSNGSAQVGIGADNLGYANQIFVYVDKDGDGVCNAEAGDLVFETQLTSRTAPISVSLDASQLAPAQSWLCAAFDPQG